MDAFDDITLEFDGEEYTVDSDRVWELLMKLENVMGYDYLIQRLAVNDLPTMHVYQAYALALRFAGHKTATPQMVMQGVNKTQLYTMAYALAGILRLTQPPADLNLGKEDPPDEDVESVKKKG